MAGKGRFYRVRSVPSILAKSYPLREVRGGTVVQALEGAPQGSLDVVDVKTASGKVKSVYSFQLERPIRKPSSWGR